MDVREMRIKAGLTQKAFADMYHIPLQTLKQWESVPESSAYRKPPEYVVLMLERLVREDFAARFAPLNRVDNLIIASQHSCGSASQWLRYLRKEFENGDVKLTEEQINKLLNCDELGMFQKVLLKRAVQYGTPTNHYVNSLNEKAKTPMADLILRRMKLSSARGQDIKDVAWIIRQQKEEDPIAFSDKLKEMGFAQIDESLILEAFGTAYGMEWLEKYYIENENAILDRL